MTSIFRPLVLRGRNSRGLALGRMDLREADALSEGSYGSNAVEVFCNGPYKAVNGTCVRAKEQLC